MVRPHEIRVLDPLSLAQVNHQQLEPSEHTPRLQACASSDRARRSTIPTPLCARNSGFSLHAAVRIPARERLRRERLARYVLRPPFAAEQLSWTPDGQILLRLARPFDDGTTALRFEPTAFLERLVALVPRPGRPMLTYHSILAPAASWRDHVVPASAPRRSPICADSAQHNASSATATSSLSSEQETRAPGGSAHSND